MYRQGDILLVKINNIPKDAIKQKKQDLIILAFGEKTGHCHAVKSNAVQEFKQKEDRFFKIGKTVILSHGLLEEIKKKEKVSKDHNIIEIPPGLYRLIHQREYSPEKTRRVSD